MPARDKSAEEVSQQARPEAAAEEPREEAGEAAAEEQGAPEPEELAGLLEDERARADEHWNQVLRLQAELDNQRKRAERDLENAHKFALEKFINELLPVYDSLEMGVVASRGDEATVESIREGVEMTLDMFRQALEKKGIETIDPEGEKFDPEAHQAMSTEAAEGEPNRVLRVMQKGYRLNGRLVRPALVVVSKKA